jgi:hypothetical protein
MNRFRYLCKDYMHLVIGDKLGQEVFFHHNLVLLYKSILSSGIVLSAGILMYYIKQHQNIVPRGLLNWKL